jgi:hypothetical protein
MNGSLAAGMMLVIAELLVTTIEILIFSLFLKEMSTRKIVIATITANACSAIVGGFIVNTLLGGLS